MLLSDHAKVAHLIPVDVVFHTLHNGTIFTCNAMLIKPIKKSHVSDGCWHKVIRDVRLLLPTFKLHKPLQTGSAFAALTGHENKQKLHCQLCSSSKYTDANMHVCVAFLALLRVYQTSCELV